MVKYDFRCKCKEECVGENGIKFYVDEVYYVDEQYTYGFCYEIYSEKGRFLSYVSFEFLGDYFTVVPEILDEIDSLFNKIMDDSIYEK